MHASCIYCAHQILPSRESSTRVRLAVFSSVYRYERPVCIAMRMMFLTETRLIA